MPTLAVLSLAVAGNLILLLTLPASEVVALHVSPPAANAIQCCNSQASLLLPSSGRLDASRSLPTSTLGSAGLFGAKRYNIYSKSTLHSSKPNGSNAVDEEVTEESSTSFLGAVDNFGMKLKPWALSRYEKSLEYSSATVNGTDTNNTTSTKGSGDRSGKVQSFLYRIQANILWMLYIVYRGYRGFFVILPAVFREVYRKLEESDLVVDVYGDDEFDNGKEYAVNANAEKKQKEPIRLRTRITISVLSAMLTLSYVVSGFLRVLGECYSLVYAFDMMLINRVILG